MGRTECLDEDLFKLMKRADCRGLWFGIESGSKRVLSFIRKGLDLDKVQDVVIAAKRAGLGVGASMIVGFPTQTIAEEQETIEFLKKVKFTIVWLGPYIGYPGSELYRDYLGIGSKYVYKEVEGIILPNSEEMTWPEKVEWSSKYAKVFNLTVRRLLYQLKVLGVISTARFALNKIFCK